MAQSAEELFNLGRDYETSGDLAAALDAYRASLKQNPRAAAPWVGLASVLDQNQQPQDALECLKRAVSVEPGNATVVVRLARSYHALGDLDAARSQYERALTIEPEKTTALIGLGELHEDLGDPDAAATSYRRVLAMYPDHADALGSIVGLGRHIDVQNEINAACQAMDRANDRDKAIIGYGLGRAFERIGDFDRAFQTLQIANTARRSIAGAFDRDAFDQRVQKLIDIFTASFFEERRSWGDASLKPIFIVGLPRSGTTLTEQILSAHPECFGAGELATLTDLATGVPDRLGRDDPPWPDCAEDLTKDHVDQIGADYVSYINARAGEGCRCVIDKQPLNFWHLGMIAMALPNARVIHCTRDIRDNGFSIFAQNFNPQQRWATDLSDIACYWQGYQRLMNHWKTVTNLKIFDSAYEELVSDTEHRSRDLLSFLSLEWDEKVLSFHQASGPVQTPSRWQVRQPIYQSSAEKWRRYEKHLGPLIDAAES
ncbi:MAG: sulfotransferase [Pseudomonadota bacterium]